ncbi:MAG TPA: hypothetical protein VKE69_04705, partial [Planctomycetota bacterium]|nr:hypothetical protein [Planctomycetota bacterium]
MHRVSALALGLLVFAPSAAAQTRVGPPSLPPGVTREQMWWAPTAEDWKRPVLVHFERNFEDAVAVSRETGKPILVCVNMDGEIASEHYAGVRYRQPEIAKLYEPYVCVIASVYRHNARDYDEQGRRILCPRFGSVTCGEHIWLEPGLFEKYFDDKRIAPRHILIELDEKKTFDVYYAWDTDSVFQAIRDGAKDRPAPKPPRGDRSPIELVASRDNDDRTAVETAYLQGDRALRRSILQAAVEHAAAASPDLLRLALRGVDPDLAQLARLALARGLSESAIGLIPEALRGTIDPAEREALFAALTKLGATSPKARSLANVQRGLSQASSAVDAESWSKALEAPPTVRDSYALESKLASRTEASASRPADPASRLEVAEATLAFAANVNVPPKNARLLFEDARRAALEAENLGATGWRVSSALAIAAWHLGDVDEARKRAESAIGGMPSDAQGWNAMAVLALFADARKQAIEKALRDKEPWPAQWLTDAGAAYDVLARHPLGTDEQAAAHHDLLKKLGAAGEASRVLDRGLARFPESWALHSRLRTRCLEEKGVDGLEATYEEMLRAKDARPSLEWFAGYASIVTAEYHKRAGRDAQALAAYDRAIAHYDRSIELSPGSRENADHYAALAIAGRARLAYERQDYERAVAELLASFERKASAAATEDGLGR